MTAGTLVPLGSGLSERKALPFLVKRIRTGLVRFPQIMVMDCLPGGAGFPFEDRKVICTRRSLVMSSSACG